MKRRRCCLLKAHGRSLVGVDRQGRLGWLGRVISFRVLNSLRGERTVIGIYEVVILYLRTGVMVVVGICTGRHGECGNEVLKLFALPRCFLDSMLCLMVKASRLA